MERRPRNVGTGKFIFLLILLLRLALCCREHRNPVATARSGPRYPQRPRSSVLVLPRAAPVAGGARLPAALPNPG